MADAMQHETTWKPGAIGTETAAGCGDEPTGVRPGTDRSHTENDSAGGLSVAESLSERRGLGLGGCSGPWPPVQVDHQTEAGTCRLSFEGGRSLWLCHRFVDLPSHRTVGGTTLRRPLPCRCHSTTDGLVGFFPLRGPNVGRSNAMKRLSPGGLKRTGRGSNAWPSDARPISFSSTKRAFCWLRWCGELGRFADRRRSCGSGRVTAAVCRPLADCRSRRADGDWAGISTSIWIGPSVKDRSSIFCGICSTIWQGRSSSYGIGWHLTGAECFASGCGGVGDSVWNTCPAMPRNSIPTNTGGRISKATRWPTIARMTRNNCMPTSCSQAEKSPANSLCSVPSSMLPIFLSGSRYELCFYRTQ